jgi:pantetheine-phosphate adenylyltransferase
VNAPMSTKALFPGSFDPLHLGHLDVISSAAELFGSVVVATMYNPEKFGGAFDLATRQQMIVESTAHLRGVEVRSFAGLVVDAARTVGADFIVKGVRTGGDFEIELQMAHTNEFVSGVKTVLLPTSSKWSFVSSRFIREISHYGGDISHLVPPAVASKLADLAQGNHR